MKKKLMNKLVLLICVMALFAAVPASANTAGKEDSDTEPAVIVEVSATPVPVAPTVTAPAISTTGEPFSVPGNGEVLDDIADNSKEFYIITTANNNTFYLVVDKAGSAQNVYMLSKVDENDLAEFIEGGIAEATPTPAPTVLLQQPTPAPTVPVVETEPIQSETGSNSYVLIAIAALAVLGGLIYFKVIKPKQEAREDDSEGMEYDDSDDSQDEE